MREFKAINDILKKLWLDLQVSPEIMVMPGPLLRKMLQEDYLPKTPIYHNPYPAAQFRAIPMLSGDPGRQTIRFYYGNHLIARYTVEDAA